MKRNAIFLAVASLFAEAALAQALPTGGNVTSGSATIGSSGSAMTVLQTTPRAVIDWSTFNIGSGYTVNFSGPGGAVLNRVPLGNVPGTPPGATVPNSSTIAGTLNGQNMLVMLMNPNGIVFTSSAIVNVGALVATTGMIDQNTFLTSGDVAITGGTGSITNAGQITVLGNHIRRPDDTLGGAGLAALVAPSVVNQGTITATGGKILLAGTEAATITMNGGLYEFALSGAGTNVTNTAGASLNGATILLGTGDVANLVSGTINLNGIQEATSAIVVNGDKVVLTSDLHVADGGVISGASNTIDVHSGAQIQDAVAIAKVGAPGAGATINVNGTFEQQVSLNKANLTLHGEPGAKIVVPNPVAADGQLNGVTVAANNVTVSDLEIAGPVTSDYLTYSWGNRITRGIVVQNGVTGFDISNNNIHDLRTGILIDGRNGTGNSVTGNTIENTKSGISVQYTDASGIAISGNTEGPIGNEWGLNLHLNGFLDGGTIYTNPHATAASLAWQQALLDLSSANGGWAVQDQGYSSSNRTHVTVKTTGSPTNQGSPLAPLNTIQGGINAVVSGGKVNVGAGTFAENLSITKALTLTGAGAANSIVDPVSGDAVSIGGNMGASATLTIDGFTFRDAQRYGVTVANDTVLAEIKIQNSDFRGNGKNGFALLGDPTTGVPGLAKVSLVNDTFVGNGTAAPTSLGYGDILINYYNRDVTFKDLRITGAGEFIGIQMRGASLTANVPQDAGTFVFDNVIIDGSFLRPNVPNGNPTYGNVGTWNPGGPGDAIHLLEYGSVANVSFKDVVIKPTVGHGMFLEGLGSTLDIGNTTFGVPDTVVTGTGLSPTISRNIFVGSNNNHLVTIVDADRSTFTSAADGFAVEDRVLHGLDFAGLGRVTWNPGNLYVTPASGGIQRGIDAASIGDTVNVQGGTFTEQLTINKSLTLLGSGASDTIVKAPASLVADGGMKSILTISGSTTDAEVSGFTFKGPVLGLDNGIFVRDGAHAHIHNNRVADIRDAAALSGTQHGVGIFVGRALLSTSGTAEIENNVITGYQKGGIVIDGPGSQATITGNTVTGEGPTTAIAQNGIQVSRGANATVTGNTVSGNAYTGPRGDADDFAAGILFFISNPYVGQGGITVGSGNTITANEFGIWTNDSRTLSTTSLAGVSGNTRNAVAYFTGGYSGQGPLLEYPAWIASNAALVNAGTFGGKQSGDIVDVGGTLKVTGWNAFAAIQPAVNAVPAGGSIDVASGTYAESVVLDGLRNLTFSGVTLEGLTINSGAAGSGIRGSVTANGSSGFVFNAPVYLLGDTSLATTGANIALNGDIQGFGGSAYALSLNAGTGDVTLVSGGTDGNPIGKLSVAANNFTLLGTLWVSGYDINALGTVALSDHTLRSVGAGVVNEITAGGDVTGSTVAESAVGVESGGSVTGSYTAPSVTVAAQETVSVAVNAPGPVEIHSAGPANITGSAPSLIIDAPGGSASGDFGQVTNVGLGVIDVNGKPLPNVALAENPNNNRVVPAEITTAASPEAAGPQRGGKVRRRKAEDALEVLENGEALEIDLSPG